MFFRFLHIFPNFCPLFIHSSLNYEYISLDLYIPAICGYFLPILLKIGWNRVLTPDVCRLGCPGHRESLIHVCYVIQTVWKHTILGNCGVSCVEWSPSRARCAVSRRLQWNIVCQWTACHVCLTVNYWWLLFVLWHFCNHNAELRPNMYFSAALLFMILLVEQLFGVQALLMYWATCWSWWQAVCHCVVSPGAVTTDHSCMESCNILIWMIWYMNRERLTWIFTIQPAGDVFLESHRAHWNDHCEERVLSHCASTWFLYVAVGGFHV